MKKLLIIPFLAALAWGQVSGTGNANVTLTIPVQQWNSRFGQLVQDTTPPIIPKYLLILRYLTSPDTGTSLAIPGASLKCCEWVYLKETYEDLKAVVERLNKGRGAIGFYPEEVVGLWRLTDHNKITLDSKVVERVEPRHVEEQRWKERVWNVTEDKAWPVP